MLHNYKINLEIIPPIAQKIADKFSRFPQVKTVALAGSRTTRVCDKSSDFDFYVYAEAKIPVEIREEIARQFSDRIEINNQFWEPGDEWIDASTGCSIDIMYRTPQWIESQLDRLLVEHQASVGYSTCFWWNVLTSVSLYDRDGWFQQLQAKVDRPYPEQLRQAIIAKNHPILRRNISAYRHQLESAVLRSDPVSIIHRIAALLGSYFDIVFAVNSIPHPGEKRLTEWAKSLCAKLPKHFDRDIHSITNAISLPAGDREILASLDVSIDSLDELLIKEGLIANRPV
jgi:predicted nucleotidyltransferase